MRRLFRAATAPVIALALLASPAHAASSSDAQFAGPRRDMVERQIRERGVTDAKLLAAIGRVPRHLFVPTTQRDEAYADTPLPIGFGQTISQPYIVALMTSLLELDGDEKVLEIGTGSGYQAAVLSELAREVYTMEILDELGHQAQRTLAELGYDNVRTRIGDGYQGWPEAQPFDAIIVTAAPPHVPQPLVDQLKVGGRMVIPVGSFFQDLMLITKTKDGVARKKLIPVRFVPMTGEVENGGARQPSTAPKPGVHPLTLIPKP